MHDQNIPASLLLQQLVNKHKNDKFAKVSEIIESLHERGFALIMILFSFPMAIPLPYPPGFTTILGTPLLFFAIQMILGMDKPWLPEWIKNKNIKISHLSWAIDKSNRYFNAVENVMKPRLMYMTSNLGERVIGVFAFCCAISIVLPIWLGNAIPSAGILIMSLGLLARDGIIVIIGMIVSVIGLIISAAVVILGIAAVKKIISYIPGLGFISSYVVMEKIPSFEEIKNFFMFKK